MDISQDPKNARRHSQRNKDAVRKSLTDLGAGRAVLADKEGVLIAGNTAFEQAQRLGLETEVVHTEGDKLLVVVRDDLAPDDPRRRALAIADNKTTDLSEFATDALKDLMTGMPDDLLIATGFDDDEIDALFKVPDAGGAGGGTDPGGAGEPTKDDPITERGRIYQLGRHLLMCGDGGDSDDVERLLSGDRAQFVFAAPPADFAAYDGLMSLLPEHLDGPFYIFFEPTMSLEFFGMFPTTLELLGSLVWMKPEPDPKGSGYRCCHEPFVYGVVKGRSPRAKGMSDEWSVWTIEETEDAKPVALIERALRNHEKGLVFDPFARTGATLIACERTRRMSRLMEADPHCCDAIVRRYCALKSLDPAEAFEKGVVVPT